MKNKVALITGASSGIGKELSKIHAERGGDLVLVARREKALDQLKKELESQYGIKVKVIVKDLALPNAPKEVYDEIKREGIKVDYLINNAGFGGGGLFFERDLKEDLKMIEVNIIALTALTRLFLSDFIRRDSGKILNVSSIAKFMPGPGQAVYSATKAYVASLNNALTEELRNTHITVTNLMPGPTHTEFAKVSDLTNTLLFKKAADAHKVAKMGYDGMLRGKMNVLGELSLFMRLAIILLPIIPSKLVLRIVYKMQMKL